MKRLKEERIPDEQLRDGKKELVSVSLNNFAVLLDGLINKVDPQVRKAYSGMVEFAQDDAALAEIESNLEQYEEIIGEAQTLQADVKKFANTYVTKKGWDF